MSENTPSFAERLGVPRGRKSNDQFMVVSEGPLMNAREASATLEAKLRINISPDEIVRLAPIVRIGRQATTFAGEPLGEIQFTLADLAHLAEQIESGQGVEDA